MARPLNKLAETAIRAKDMKPGRYNDGGGLYLVVSKAGSKSWIFRYKRDGAKWPREAGLGRYPEITLSDARQLAFECRQRLEVGKDPITERRREAVPSFAEAADLFLESMETAWRNEKHRAQWRMTLTEYCMPIRKKRVVDVSTDDVLSVLKPHWNTRPETASRLRGRIERVLNFSKSRGWRTGENPAQWKNHLENILPPAKKLSRGHHAALPYGSIPDFMRRLREQNALSAIALEFIVLTAARTSEALKAEWREVDFEAEVWIVPASRMKAGREHRVPLAPRVLSILRELHEVKLGKFIFPGQRPRKGEDERPLSQMACSMALRRLGHGDITVHGFRSTFRDWAGDKTSFPREIAEAALAHVIGNRVEAAYRRSDALEKRRQLMLAWEQYCASTNALTERIANRGPK